MAQAPREYKPVAFYKPSAQQRGDDFYHRKAWRVASKTHMVREPLCRICDEPAQCVDHIIPLKAGGDPYSESNLQSLCRRCHALKTREEMKGRGF